MLKKNRMEKIDNFFDLNFVLLMEVIWIKKVDWLIVEIKWEVLYVLNVSLINFMIDYYVQNFLYGIVSVMIILQYKLGIGKC